MNLRWMLALQVGALPLLGCSGDDAGGADETTEGSGSGSDTTAGMSAGDDVITETTGGDDDNPTSADDVEPDTGPGDSDTTGDPDSSTTDDDTTTSTGFDCATDVLPGPFTPQEQFTGVLFAGSEDLSFDGSGGLAAKNGGSVFIVDADGGMVDSFADMGSAYGLRYRGNGDLLVAHFMSGIVVAYEPDGSSSNFLMGVPGVNGLYPDLDDAVWFTDGNSVNRVNSDGSRDTIVSGSEAQFANGIVYDPDRGVAFFTNYLSGRVAKVAIDDLGEPGDITEVATIDGGNPDGLALDICGNLYVVDQGNSDLYRIMLDDAAEAIGAPENLLDSPIQNIANAQFGRGAGWDETAIYAAGTPGVVYRIEVGVEGAEIALP